MCIMNDPLEPPPLPAASIMDDGGALWCAAGWLAGRLGAPVESRPDVGVA